MGTSPPPYLHLPLLANHFLLWRTLPLQLFFKSESMIFIAICCRSSFCLKLERSLPVASICLPAFLLSFPERQRHPGPSGGSYEDESLMEEQQRQIPGENFSRVSRFLSVNWRGRAEAVFMDGSWLTTDALTILLYCAIPNHTYHTFCLTIQCHPLLYITIRKHRPATDALPAAGSSSSQPTLIDSIKLPCGEIWILLKATRIQSRWAQHSISVEIITLPSHAVAQILSRFRDIFLPPTVGGKHQG